MAGKLNDNSDTIGQDVSFVSLRCKMLFLQAESIN
jgi:hypothetical protein